MSFSEDQPDKKPKRVIRRRRQQPNNTTPSIAIDPILLDEILQQSHLPDAYSWEITKTAQRIHSLQATCIAMQLPEGLLLYATVLGDIFKRLCPTLQTVSILGDVCYGACCVDDLGAQALGAQLLVHYGHSCLVPLQHTVIPCLYVFVQIEIDTPHLVQCLQKTLVESNHPHRDDDTCMIYLLGTIQFRHALPLALDLLQEQGYTVTIPQVKPLSPGEVLGCTSPKLDKDGIVCFVADGRFHLESTMISNPHIHAYYRYDPYHKTMTLETYQHADMHAIRQDMIHNAQQHDTHRFGVILGTLGRQGNPAIVKRICQALKEHDKPYFIILLSEITPHKLKLLPTIDCWVQVACPRLSVDWGQFLSDKPVLNPYELFVCLQDAEWQEVYPMDYYSQAGGPWTNYHDEVAKARHIMDVQASNKET